MPKLHILTRRCGDCNRRSSLLFCFRSASHVHFVPLPPVTRRSARARARTRALRLSAPRLPASFLSAVSASQVSLFLFAAVPPPAFPGPCAWISLTIRAASLFLIRASTSHLHAKTCNSGPYESSLVTSAYRRRNQRIPFVTLPPRAYFIARRTARGFHECRHTLPRSAHTICIRNRAASVFRKPVMIDARRINPPRTDRARTTSRNK